MELEKREQVFVSSTYIDLVEERQEVIQTLLEADCVPSGMELFPASDDDRWTLIKRVIDDSDYYIVVIGGRYGSIDHDRGLSFTEMEFDYAVSQKKPVMGFLHSEPDRIEAGKTELAPDRRAKLEAFRAKVGERMVKHWSSPQELGGQVAKSLIQIRKTHPAEGWIRARNALTAEVEQELIELRARVAELTAELTERRRGPIGEIETFAQGADVYELVCVLAYYPKGLPVRDQWYQNVKTRRYIVTVTWDDMFGAIAPLMMDEAAEADIQEKLDGFAGGELSKDFEPFDDFGRSTGVTAGSDVINDVKVQLFAIGLIERSERRRGVSDKNAYWKLTESGRDRLMRLRAIRRPSSEGQAAERALGDDGTDAVAP